MSGKTYALVGSFDFNATQRGITVFVYDENRGTLEKPRNFVPELNVGQQSYNAGHGLVYLVDESKTLRDENEGGGRVAALHLDMATGALKTKDLRSSVSALPSCFQVDKTNRYALVTHFCFNHYVTKVVRDESGSWRQEVQFDDAALALFHLDKDGGIGEVCDVKLHKGTGIPGPNAVSHLHWVAMSPDGKLFLVCDTGCDRILSYGLDAENSRLVYKGETLVETGSMPRYGLFHPEKNVFYCNNENAASVYAFGYDSESGGLERFCTAALFAETLPADVDVMPSDISLHPNGRTMYVAVRNVEKIAVLHIDQDGRPAPVQNVDCGGAGPRGLCLSPDGRFLFVANRNSNSIDMFKVNCDGLLTYACRSAKVESPGNMQIIAVDDAEWGGRSL